MVLSAFGEAYKNQNSWLKTDEFGVNSSKVQLSRCLSDLSELLDDLVIY